MIKIRLFLSILLFEFIDSVKFEINIKMKTYKIVLNFYLEY